MSLTKVGLLPAEIEALARAAFGSATRLASARPAKDGMYNAAYHLELAGDGPAEVFLKVAPPDGVPVLTYEKNLLRTEIAMLQAAGAAGVAAVPAVVAEDFSRRIVDRDVLFMQALQGVSLTTVVKTLAEPDRLDLRRQIGAIAASFAAVTAPAFGYPGAADLRADAWPEAVRRMFAALLADAARFETVLPVPADEISAQVEAALPLLAGTTTPRLVHYDLWDGNVLVGRDAERWRVTGVIDWERAFFGDPLAEVVSLVLLDDAAERAALLDALARAGGPTLATPQAERRLALYQAYLWLIMIVEAAPRGLGGSILLPTSWAARRLRRDLAIAADRG